MAAASTERVVKIKTKDLLFDPENPRFYRLNDSSLTSSVIEEMLDGESVQDLMLSIGEKGYFEGEPLLAVPSKEKGKYTVIEGNRRLAAVKLLNQEFTPPSRRKNSVSELISQIRVQLLNCV